VNSDLITGVLDPISDVLDLILDVLDPIGRPRSDIGSKIFRDPISSSQRWDDVHPTSDVRRPISDQIVQSNLNSPNRWIQIWSGPTSDSGSGSGIFRDPISSSQRWDEVHSTSDVGRPISDRIVRSNLNLPNRWIQIWSGPTSVSGSGSGIFRDLKSSSQSREDVHPILDLGRLRSDIRRPRSNIVRPRLDIGRPRPDVGGPRPNIGRPRPDVGRPRPNIGPPTPDIGRLRSDIGSEIFRDLTSSSQRWDDVHPTSDVGRPIPDQIVRLNLNSPNGYPLRKNHKWRLGAQTSNRFEKSFWVHGWGVVGKTWPNYEVNQSSALSLASIFVVVFLLMKITNDDGGLKPVTGMTIHFGYMSEVLWVRPGQNMRSIRVLVWVWHQFLRLCAL
jgi:hypothetical protein